MTLYAGCTKVVEIGRDSQEERDIHIYIFIVVWQKPMQTTKL